MSHVLYKKVGKPVFTPRNYPHSISNTLTERIQMTTLQVDAPIAGQAIVEVTEPRRVIDVIVESS